MTKKEINPLLIIALLIGLAYLYSHSSLFSIQLESNIVQYYNVPISAVFKTNLTDPTITAYYNDIELLTVIGNGTIQDISYTQGVVNGSYTLTISNVTQAGLFKFIAKQDNLTETQTIEVRKPFVDEQNDIPNNVSAGTSAKFIFKTYTPQGDPLVADAVDITVFDPDNKESVLTTTKTTANEYSATFSYASAGNYQFKIKPRKEGFDTKEFTVITSVTKSAGIHPIIWVWVVAVVVFIILFVIRRFRR